MEYTKNLKLSKPSYDDDVDVQVLNNNSDILDDFVANLITNVDNQNVQMKAPTLRLVHELIEVFKIKTPQDVVQALGSETLKALGVKFDFSDSNGWYICLGQLFGNLIIQGGRKVAGAQTSFDANNLEGTTTKVTFPIAFKQQCLFHNFSIVASDTSGFWGNSAACVLLRRESLTDMRYDVHSSYQSMLTEDSIIQWCVVGI